jgi:hypothetical protein
MRRRAAPPLVLTLAALAGGCSAPHHDAVMQGNVDGVVINYFGDISETMPLAQQFCARYERTPVLHETKEDNAYYFCVKASEAPHPTS